MSVIGYKLVRKMKDGTLSSLFINKKDRLKIGEWMQAEDHQTKGYAHRPGWHCTLKPKAPHLSEEGRVWVKLEAQEVEYHRRPDSQGGVWMLAKYIKILEEL